MAKIAFHFHNKLALRIANLITGDIEKLERDVLGTVTNWQSKYERPFKAFYANDVVARAASSNEATAKILKVLPYYESRAKAYADNPQKRGRPLTTFVHADDPATHDDMAQRARDDMAQMARDAGFSVESVDNGLADEIASILSDNTPVPQGRKAPQAVDGMAPDAQAALAALMAALTPKVEIDEAMVREIARDEAKKTISPTIVHIARQVQDETQIIDLGVQHVSFPILVQTLQARFPVWMPGPAGSGKTTAAKHAAKALDVAFHHTGAVDNVYQLLGFIDAGGTYHRTTFREAYENGGVFLWDEVDASNPAALVAFNAALENGECVFPDKVVPKHADCYFIAAANTYGTGATHEYVGRTKIDAATVDRFIMLDWQYDEILERAIAGDNEWTSYVQKIRAACKAAGVKHLVTPRASLRGNALLAAGISRDSVINMTVRKGLSEDQWNNIRTKAGVR